MEVVNLKNNIKVICVEAVSFPDGILQAHEKLESLLPSRGDRSFYGISYPDSRGQIIYKAATTEAYDGEADKLECQTFTISKGSFLSKLVPDWCESEHKVKDTFNGLLSDVNIHKEGYCLEEYISNKDMRCMVPLQETKEEDLSEQLIPQIETTFNKIIHVLSPFDNEQLNKSLDNGSWSAGQVIDHVLKSVSELPDQTTKPAVRFHDQKVQPVKKLFLDFDIKMESPEFIIPEKRMFDKDELIKALLQVQSAHIKLAKELDLTVLCLDFELPTFGFLTRYEWLSFFIFHIQRHTHQIQNIYRGLS